MLDRNKNLFEIVTPSWLKVALILLSVFALSCGKKPTNNLKEDEDPINKVRPLVDNDFTKLVKDQELVCNQDNCPEYLVQVYIKDDLNSSINTCSGFVVNEDYILTSAQCIPENLSQDGIDCSSNIYSIFQKSTGQEPIECESIEKISFIAHQSEPATWPSDFALLKMSRKIESIKGLTLSDEGMEEGTDVEVWGVKRVGQQLSYVESDTCDVVWNSYAQPFAVSARSPSITIGSCDFPETFRGGPVLGTSNAEVVNYSQMVGLGVFSSRVSKELLAEIPGQIMNEEPLSLAYVSNIACMPLDDNARVIHSDCSVSMGYSELANARAELLNSFEELTVIKNFVNGQLFEEDQYFRWKADYEFNSEEFRYMIVPAPTCFHNVDDWINDFRGTRKKWKKSTVSRQWPKWLIRTSLDPYLRVSLHLDQSEELVTYRMTFSPKLLANEERTYLDIDVSNQDLSIPDFDVFGICD
jgi:hypothetical protein